MGKTAARQPSKTREKKPAFQLSQAPLTHGHASPPTAEPARSSESLRLRKKPRASRRDSTPTPAGEPPDFEDLGQLPASYGSQTLFLIARDPECLFCYWDIDWENRPGAPGSRVVLRLFHPQGEAYRAEITPDARDWYIPTRDIALRPTGTDATAPGFHAEIGYLAADGSWDGIALSNTARLPSHAIASTALDTFATIPFHLAFQQIQEMLEKTRRAGEPLTSALSRVQTEGRNVLITLGRAPGWTPEQRHLLATLLGHEWNRLAALAPEEIDKLLRDQLQQHLASAGASLSTAALAASTASAETSSLDSGHLGQWGNAEALSSFDHNFWSSWLSSWKEGVLASHSLAGGMLAAESFSSEVSLASWLSSWPGARELTAGSALSSALSSWPEAIGERAFWSSWLTSWSHGAAGWSESSGGSGGMSSFGLSSSWNAHPGAGARDFFMHVNAEVIFYGGTHPDATLWIDGQPVPLNPDGTFHFHFRFPDGDRTVPIVAQSPDGVEQRSVSLRLARGTTRQGGEIGHTAQPAHLPPLGSGFGS